VTTNSTAIGLTRESELPSGRQVRLSVISPTYNESGNVGPLIQALGEALKGIEYEIIISDDDSPDLTWFRVECISKEQNRVHALRRMRNRGLGPAVIDGFTVAHGGVVACIDADLQHDPSILPKMLAAVERGADLVVGTRYMPGGGTTNWNPIRRLGSWIATQMARVSLGVPLRDPMSGYFMLRRDDFVRASGRLNGRGFKILLEIVAHMKPRSLDEVPYTFRPRLAGESKLCTRVVFDYFYQLCSLVFQRWVSEYLQKPGSRTEIAKESSAEQSRHDRVA
jgi:dolichol-phosphate mannosyltransferase